MLGFFLQERSKGEKRINLRRKDVATEWNGFMERREEGTNR